MAATDTNTKDILEVSDIVTCEILIENEKIEKKHHIVSITVETGINKIPKATIQVNDGAASEKSFEVSDSDLFLPGKKIEVQLGYRKEKKSVVKSVFKGIIIGNNHKINNHCSELNIDCKHDAEIMTFTNANSCPPENRADSDIIKDILTKNHLDYDVIDSSAAQQQVVQANVSDWDFIMGRIDVAQLICTFPDSKLTIKKIPEQDTQLDADSTDDAGPKPDISEQQTFTYGKNILEFNGDLDARVESTMVKVVSWDYTNQRIKETEDESAANSSNTNTHTPNRLQYDWIIRTPVTIPEQTQQAITNAKKRRQELSRIKGTVKFLGRSTINPGEFIKIAGVGKRFDGTAFVSNILHEYADGCWFTTATLGWDAKFFTEQTNPTSPTAATGQVSPIQGLHSGKVTSIEDKDGDYRVRVKLPVVDDNSEGIYARVATLDAGKNRGSFFRPEIEDEVILGFVGSDSSNPVILGMLHSSALPAPLEPEKNNHQKGYVSRSGVRWIIHDDDKSFSIKTPGNRVIELHDKDGSISLKDDFGNSIIMDQSGITIQSDGDIKMVAKKNVSLSGDADVSLNAKKSLAAEATGPLSIKSGANTEIKGTMVMIN